MHLVGSARRPCVPLIQSPAAVIASSLSPKSWPNFVVSLRVELEYMHLISSVHLDIVSCHVQFKRVLIVLVLHGLLAKFITYRGIKLDLKRPSQNRTVM